jgi:capsular polysaccharide biosynthesis protein
LREIMPTATVAGPENAAVVATVVEAEAEAEAVAVAVALSEPAQSSEQRLMRAGEACTLSYA